MAGPWEKYQTQAASKPWEKYGAPVVQAAAEKESAPTNQYKGVVAEAGRTLGRTERATIAAGAGLIDVGLLPIKTGILGAGILAEKAGAEKLGGALQEIGMTPPVREQALDFVDKVTGGFLQPRDTQEKVFDFFAEMIAAPIAVGKAQKIANTTYQKFSREVKKFNSTRLRREATRAYKLAEEKGGALSGKFLDDYIERIKGLGAKTKLGEAIAGPNLADDLIERIAPFKGQKLTLEAAKDADEAFTQLINKHVDVTGRLTSEGHKLYEMQTVFRSKLEHAGAKYIEGSDEGFAAWKAGKTLWAQSRRMEDVENIIARANMTDNPASALRSGFRSLATNKKRLRGFSEAEKNAIKKAASTGLPTDILKVLGSRLNPIAFMATGGADAGALSYVTSALSREGATQLQMRRAANVIAVISKSSATPQKAVKELVRSFSKKELAALGGTKGLQGLVEQLKRRKKPNNKLSQQKTNSGI